MEKVARRDLVSAVTASGKIEAKTSVDISADITGRIIQIAVREGDLVNKGQFLIQIDPAQYQAAVSRAQGVVASTEATLLQARANLDQAERAWNRARQLTQLGRQPDRAGGRRAGADTSLRRGAGDLAGDPGAARAVAREPAGGARQPVQDAAHLAHLGAGGASRGRGGRGGGARHVLAGDRAAHDRRGPLGHPGQGAGGRDRRRPPRAQRLGRGDHRRLSRYDLHGPGDPDQPQRQADRRRRRRRAPTTAPWISTSRSPSTARRATSGPT